MLDEFSTSFNVDDILISRTDGRGVITAANATFQRVSGYLWEELEGAPHKLVRHPDMPKAVFKLMWDTIERGEPISAFVKNRTKRGDHYWVFATVIPVGEGYMSVRMKPSDDMVATIGKLYAEVREAERDQNLEASESVKFLRKAIQKTGQNGYWDFMARVGAEQWIKRNTDCNRPRDLGIERLLSVLKEWDDVQKVCGDVLERHDAFETSPLNLRIQAAQLGDNGRALDIIASSFTDLARQIRESMKQFAERVERVSGTIRKSTYLLCVDRLLSEAERELRTEVAHGDNIAAELDFMTQQSKELSRQAQSVVNDVRREFAAFENDLWSTKRNLTGLSLTRVMSAIENAQVRSGSVMSIIDELKAFQEFSDVSLRGVQNSISRMQGRL